MNIRSLSNPAQILAKDKIAEERKDIKSGQTADRDADGRRSYESKKRARRPLSEEELEEVLQKIKSHDGIVKNNLQVHMVREGNQHIVRIEDQQGKVVKRIVEAALFDYLFEGQDDGFHLVQKIA